MLSHHDLRMSIIVAAAAAVLAGPATAAAAAPLTYLGRWTVAEDSPVFSVKGRFYKTVDLARCGADVCGVSVADNGACGSVLFRFHSATLAKETSVYYGHGRWGKAKTNLGLGIWKDSDVPGGRRMNITLGDGYDFGLRSGNMPKFSAEYRPTGNARCVAR